MPVYSWTLYFCDTPLHTFFIFLHYFMFPIIILTLLYVKQTHEQHSNMSRFHQSYRSCVYQSCRMELLSTVSSRRSAPPQDLSTSGPLWTQTLSSSDSFMPVVPQRWTELSILNSLVFWLFHACCSSEVNRALHPKLSRLLTLSCLLFLRGEQSSPS